MMVRRVNHWAFVAALALLLASARDVAAQANVGAGPMTSALPETEPTTGVIDLGLLRMAPGLAIPELGWDSNVFQEEENPQEDYVAAIVPDISAFTRLRLLKFAGYAGADLRYYSTHESERSTGYMTRGRVDLLLSRFRPFFGGGRNDVRMRPNGEIDVRANRIETELSGGIAFDVSRYGQFYGSFSHYNTEYEESVEEGVPLGPSLNHFNDSYQAGIRSELTPLTALIVSGSYFEDKFQSLPIRNASGKSIDGTLRFASDAVITGFVTISWRVQSPVDPALREYSGFTGRAGIVYPFLDVGRLSVTFNRGTEYSFRVSDGYYLQNSLSLNYTHRLFGNVDVNVAGSKAVYDYRFVEALPDRKDDLESAGGGVGYNLPNRTRIAVNYEYSRRRSPEIPERNFDRRRVYLNWQFVF